MLFAVTALVLVACQQNTPKEIASAEGENAIATTLQEQPNEAQVNPEEQATTEVDNHWKELKIKGEVKVLTEIIYEGIEKDGKVVKDERKKKPLSITRTFFDSKGFMTLMERFKDLQMKKTYETEKYQYNEKGQLLETIISAVGGETQYTYSYNEQGDKILESFKDPYVGEPLKTEYHYEYTPEGKRRTQIRKFEDVKEIAYYDKKNVYVKKNAMMLRIILLGKPSFPMMRRACLSRMLPYWTMKKQP